MRPQSIGIHDNGITNEKLLNDTYVLAGDIEYSEFLGDTVRYSVNISGHSILSDEPHQRGSMIMEPGQKVWITIPKNQILLLDK